MFRDVFLISIDCLRPDYLGAYNLLRRQTPNLDVLAQGAAVFTQAVSHAPFTTPALASLLTGRYPYQTGVRLLLGQLCDANAATLAEFARRAGYLTAGFPPTFILNRRTGLGRGFDHYRDIEDGIDTGRGGCWQKGDRLNQALDEFLTGAAFILTADHGEDLFQHGHRGHGHHLYDTVLRVPLIWNFREPALARRIDCQVRHVDIMPTLLELWGFPRESWPAGLDGRSLVPLLGGDEAPEDGEPRPANCSYAEASPRQLFEGDIKSYRAFAGPEQRSLRSGSFKFIAHADGRRELYDLRDDPQEMTNIAGDRAELADRFAHTLAEMTAGDDNRFRQIEFSADEEEKVMSRLRELGYVA